MIAPPHLDCGDSSPLLEAMGRHRSLEHQMLTTRFPWTGALQSFRESGQSIPGLRQSPPGFRK
jgi:hypothetical protein